MGGGIREKPVKVVIINTQYVQTDAASFKSVVQNLTGKDTVVGEEQPPAKVTQFRRGMSFKDLDLMVQELPPLDELMKLFPDL